LEQEQVYGDPLNFLFLLPAQYYGSVIRSYARFHGSQPGFFRWASGPWFFTCAKI